MDGAGRASRSVRDLSEVTFYSSSSVPTSPARPCPPCNCPYSLSAILSTPPPILLLTPWPTHLPRSRLLNRDDLTRRAIDEAEAKISSQVI